MDEIDRQDRDEEALEIARQKVYDVFGELGIPYEAVSHPPIFSASDRVRQEIEVDGLICKNLFLRNKDKSRYYLYTLPIDKRGDLLALQKALGESRLSFGGADALWDRLRITPGSVSLLNIVGAAESARAEGLEYRPQLKFLVDADTLAVPRIGLHPNDNAATIVFPAERLPDIFACYGADFEFVELP